MKHLYRKPLFPALLLAILIFGCCFMTLFEKDSAEDRLRIEDIYNNTRIYIEALPAEDDGDTLRMNTHRGDTAAQLEEIESSLVMLECPYAIHAPQALGAISLAYATNAPDALASYQNFKIAWGEGWDEARFLQTEEQTACLMDEVLANILGLQSGDPVTIAPAREIGVEYDYAPERTLVLAGTISGKQSELMGNAIIMPRSNFVGADGMLYTVSMMTNCYYRAYRLELKREYNRDIHTAVEHVENALIDDYTIITNADTITNAIRPIELKLQLQSMLRLPLLLVFCATTAVLGLLLAMSLKTEIFLRFLMGRGRLSVFGRLSGLLVLLLVCFGLLALGVTWAAAGTAWLRTAGEYLALTLALTLLTTLLPLARMCSKNLIKLYQEREG